VLQQVSKQATFPPLKTPYPYPGSSARWSENQIVGSASCSALSRGPGNRALMLIAASPRRFVSHT